VHMTTMMTSIMMRFFCFFFFCFFSSFFLILLCGKDSFSDDGYYHSDGPRVADVVPVVKVEDLRKSLNGQASLKKSMDGREGKNSGDVSQEIVLLLDKPGAMQVSQYVFRVPLYVPRNVTDAVPLLVLQFDMQPPYPLTKVPGISIVTASLFVSDESKQYLLHWLNAQAQTKLGKPFVSALVGLAAMWAEIQHESEVSRLEAEDERQRKKDAKMLRQKEKEEEEKYEKKWGKKDMF
jgi:hypothetical protein